MNPKTFMAVISLCLFIFCSCAQKKHQEVISVPPLPKISPALKSPQSCMVETQKFMEIEKLFSENNFKPALKMAAEIIETPCSLDSYLSILELTGDIFNKRKEPVNAFYFYDEAFEHLKDETSSPRAQALIEKMKQTISPMKVQDTISLLTLTRTKKDIHGRLLFLSALSKKKAGNESDAILLLDEFIKAFPTHKDRDQAVSLLSNIKNKENFPENKEFHNNRIGVLLPLTGNYQVAGHRALKAIEMAVDQFNSTQTKITFQLFVEDTASDPDTATEAVKNLDKEKVACIIGPMITAPSAAIESNTLGIPMIAMTQKSDVTEAGPFVLRNYMTPSRQIKTGISYFLETYGFTRFAILYPNDKYGIAFKETFIDIHSQYDTQLTEILAYDPSQTDFSDQIRQFIIGYQKKDENNVYIDMDENEEKERNRIYRARIDFDVLFIPDTVAAVSMIAPQLKYHGIEVELMGTNLWNSKELLDIKNYVQGAVFPDGFSLHSDTERAKEFISSYFQSFGEFPEYTEAIAHDSVSMVMDALSSPAVTSRKEVVTYLQSNTFDKGITCPTSFDLQGEPVNSLELFQVLDNEIILIRSCDLSISGSLTSASIIGEKNSLLRLLYK